MPPFLPPSKTIFNNFFENMKFLHVSPILLESHNYFCQTHGPELDNPDSASYLNWLSLISDIMSVENKKFQVKSYCSLCIANNKFYHSSKHLKKKVSG